MREYLVRFRGPSPDDSQRARMVNAGAPIVAEPTDWRQRHHGVMYHRVLVTAKDEEAALKIVRSVLGPGNPGDYWDQFEIKPYENETADQILAEDSHAASRDRAG